MNKDDFLFLNQMIKSLEDASEKLQTAYEKEDYTKFNNSKKLILKMQNEINNLLIS